MTPHAIDRETLQTLSVPSNPRTLFDFFFSWGVMAGAMAGAHVVGRAYAYALAIIVIGSRQNALATLAHEGWHSLLFSSRRLNNAFGAWLYAYPLGILYYHDRDRHLRHHREVGHDYDPDWINYTTSRGKSPGHVLWYLLSLLCGRLLFSTLWSFVKRGQPRIGLESAGSTETRGHRPRLQVEFLKVLVCQAALFGVMAIASHRWWSYALLWALPLATFAGFFANFRALIEHVAVQDDVPVEHRLRDIKAGPIERFFIAPSHFNYHALHHAHPSIPHYNLTRGREAYLQKFGFYPFTVWPGYVKGFFAHLKELRST